MLKKKKKSFIHCGQRAVRPLIKPCWLYHSANCDLCLPCRLALVVDQYQQWLYVFKQCGRDEPLLKPIRCFLSTRGANVLMKRALRSHVVLQSSAAPTSNARWNVTAPFLCTQLLVAAPSAVTEPAKFLLVSLQGEAFSWPARGELILKSVQVTQRIF